MARICSVCGKKADTMLYTANQIGSSVFCADCYAKIPDFDRNEKFSSPEALTEKENKVLKEAEENHFPVSVQEDIRYFYEGNRPVPDVQSRLSWITTTPSFDGYHIISYKGLVSGEVVLGTGFLSGLDASFAGFTGTESGAYQTKIDEAEQKATELAIRDALKLGGNAVVGAKMDLEVVNNGMVCVLVTGTAVTIAKAE